VVSKREILEKVDQNKPLFTSWPVRKRKSIIGTEQEFGNVHPKALDVPGPIPNGGLIYFDSGHIEYCTPECQEITRVVGYDKAGETLVLPLAQQIFKHVVALKCTEEIEKNPQIETTFGAHENYTTTVPYERWAEFIPFFIVRQLISGAGYVSPQGEWELSQRAHCIVTPISGETLTNRAIINIRDEPLSTIRGLKRFHYIGGEGTMLETALFLKIGLTRAVLDLAEDEILPQVIYRIDKVIEDLHNVSKKGVHTPLESVSRKVTALELLQRYCQAIKINYRGRDEETDTLIVLAEDTLEKLGGNQQGLERRLDWAAKKAFIELRTEDMLADAYALDHAFNDCNPETGMYAWMRRHNFFERVLSNKLLGECLNSPPPNTRAHARGKIAKLLKGTERKLQHHCWDELNIVPRPKNRQDRLNIYNFEYECPEESYPFGNPFETYIDLLTKIKS